MSTVLKEKSVYKMKKRFYIFFVLIISLVGCTQSTDKAKLNAFCKNQLPQWNRKLTRVIITDIFTPPVCSRIYAYCNIAAYEAMRHTDSSYKTYAGVLHGLSPLPAAAANKEKCFYSVAGVIAFSTTAQKLVFNRDAIEEMENEYLKELRTILNDNRLIDDAIAFGKQIANHIIEWAAKDGYLQRTSLPGYFVNKQPWRWQPTPPDYMDAIEPNWNTLRTFILDSAGQFLPPPPVVFDTLQNSLFYKEAIQVYDAVNKKENIPVAKFWDCNPNVSVTQGHVMYFQQRISPGGHWIHVAASVTENENYDEVKQAAILSKVAVTIADAFISCWDTKYKYNLLRPETYINKYIDKDWRPLLQTPPFPEYPSGHSVASASAAAMLTHLIGDNYQYIDSTELPFGLPARKFNSFLEAADEACLSRLYGGIHFMPAIVHGKEEGRKIGNFIISKIN
jgi:hypothetical protein